MKLNKTILIIGGMGPTASEFAHKLILEKCISKGLVNNDDFPIIIHISINVEDFIDSKSSNYLKGLKYISDKLSLINMLKIDTGFIACNTAHVIFDEINEKCNRKLISIIEETKKETALNDKIGIVCTPFTATHNVYFNEELVIPNDEQFLQLNTIIRSVIKGRITDKILYEFSKIIDSLLDRGCNKIIIGCTELSILADKIKTRFPKGILIDPIQIIAERIVNE